ncbi:MAG: hypothetical protein IR526_01970 [Bordetella sp.]|nr:MAG: hypothetical protein IR526_01970 [Bordetella sp.]
MSRILAIFFAVAYSSIIRGAPYPEIIIESNHETSNILIVVKNTISMVSALSSNQDDSAGGVEHLHKVMHDEIRAALAAEGYFSSTVTFAINNKYLNLYCIRISLGERTIISSVDLKISYRVDPSNSDIDFKKIDQLREAWDSQIGQPFSNKSWNKIKFSLLDEISSQSFMLAHIIHSSATVNLEKNEVNLSVHIDSGPRILMGPLYTYGFKRIPENIINQYIDYKKGEPFNQKRINTWQKNLQATGLFRGVFISLVNPITEISFLPYYENNKFLLENDLYKENGESFSKDDFNLILN